MHPSARNHFADDIVDSEMVFILILKTFNTILGNDYMYFNILYSLTNFNIFSKLSMRMHIRRKKIYACIQLIPQFHVNSVVYAVGDQVLKFTPLYFDAKAEIPADWSIYVHF